MVVDLSGKEESLPKPVEKHETIGGEISSYLGKALPVLKKFGIVPREEESKLAGLLQDVVCIDEPKVLAIARIVENMGAFNQLVRDNISGMTVDDRYAHITEAFNSIREDYKKLDEQLADGKIDFREKMQNWWMALARGTTHKRFEKIRETFLSVTDDTETQISKEDEIINAYCDFRLSVKQAEGLSYQVLEVEIKRLQDSKNKLSAASAAVDSFKGEDSEKSGLELKRDEAQIAYQQEDKRYQLVKDVAENIKVGYNIGEALIARLNQTHDVKKQVYSRSVTFFQTNEHVFTTMDAVYTSQQGLTEATKSLDAMEKGAEEGIKDIAAMTGKLEEAVKVGYGKTIDSGAVKVLVDAIVDYQTKSIQWIGESRKLATENASLIENIVEDGKKRYSNAILNYQQNPAA